MATNYPSALDDGTSLPNPSSSNVPNSPSHAGLHSNAQDAIKATETKLGTGASTPASNTLLIGTGTGTSSWSALTSSQLAGVLSDETGTGSAVFATTPTLVTPKVDTINESTLNNGVTVGGVNLKSGVIITSSSVPTAALQSAAIDYTKVATGFAVQQVSSLYSAVVTGTTTIPLDDTIPQNTEGDQYMTLAITPKSTTNILVIDVTVSLANSAVVHLIAALFQDSTANALAAINQFQETSGGNRIIRVLHTMAAGTTSATTFKVRAGGSGAGTTTFNGAAGARLFGAITKSSITVTEYKA